MVMVKYWCKRLHKEAYRMKITQSAFGKADQHEVTKYTVTNDHGVKMSVLSFGGIWQEYSVPTDHGQLNLLLAANSMEDYLDAGYSICQLIGPVANRIGKASFQIDNHEYQLQANEGANSIHSGDQGWQNHFWHVQTATSASAGQIILSNHYSPEDDGMPANTDVHIVYTLHDDDSVTIDMYGEADAPTLFNPTNHAYWNLADADVDTIEGQELTINSRYHLAVNGEKIPTGALVENLGSAYDFKDGQVLGHALNEMLKTPEKGFDDFFVVKPSTTFAQEPIAKLRDPQSGRELQMYSDRNALVIFSANGLPASVKLNRPGKSWAALALEAQSLPDAPHHPEFGDITLRPLAPVHNQIRYAIKF